MTIKTHADHLLQRTGLLDCLQRYANVHITGSYRMDIMSWNDLDIYLEADLASFNIYPMIAEVNSLLHPHRFDGFTDKDKAFYGLETFVAGERWNIDIWIKTADEIRRSIEYYTSISQIISDNPAKRNAILSIKAELISMGLYGFDKNKDHHYHSNEIYDAVLQADILTTEELLRRHPV